MLFVTTTNVIFYLSLLVPLAATTSFILSNFDRDTKLTCSSNQKGICLQGDAFLNQGLQLTKNQLHSSISSSVGRAVYSQPVHIWDSVTGRIADFKTQFSFIIHEVDPWRPSGDGLAFFLSSHPSVIPDNSAGGFLGLFSNSSHGDGHDKILAIEFDTYPNSEMDSSSSDHIGINVNSIQSVLDLTLEGGIRKGTLAKAWVEYNASGQTLSLAFAYGDASLKGNSNLSHVLDLREVLPEYVSVGFSAATGSFIETNTILSWSFDSNLGVGSSSAPMTIMAGALMVCILFLWLLMWNWRKPAPMKADIVNISKYAVLDSEKNEKKKDKDMNIDAKHIKEMGRKGEVTGVSTILTEVSGENLMKDEDIALSEMSLWEAGEKETEDSSSGPLTNRDQGQEEEDVSLYAECTEEDAYGITGSLEISGIVLDTWSPKEIPYHVLVSATNNFSEEMILGKGGFGPVYRGFLSDLGLGVAIKKLSERSEQGVSEYMSEVRIITQVRHRNLVKLIGWCHEHGEILLVYEFMPSGSLDNHLFKGNDLLEWSVRYKIVLGLANALVYLHDECEPYVLHRDIKPSNVLLDSKFEAKLADFGLAKLFNLDVTSLRVTHPAGTRGYWAPEYALMSKAGKRSDVYSYGVVVLEVACGKKAIQMIQEDDGESYPMLLVEWVWDLYGKGAILDAADKRLDGSFDQLQMERLLMVGLWCAHPDDRKRPSMRQAISALTFSETNPLPNLPKEVPPWAFPLTCKQMQMVQASPGALSSATTTFTKSAEPLPSISQHGRYGGRDLDTWPRRIASKKLRSWLFPRFTWWLKRRKVAGLDESPDRRKAISFDESLDEDDDRMRMVTGLKEFSYDELVQATDNFSPDKKLSECVFFNVYKGQLASGIAVSVKRLLDCSSQARAEYMAEAMTLSRLAHRNLEKLIGWCHEGSEYLLVCEYIGEGTLDHYLFGEVGGRRMPWEVRYKVALNLASALCYLHNGLECCVLHRNIKPSSWFLDEEFNIKLCDFGWAKLTDHAVLTTTRVVGSLGYLAPEYAQYGKCSTASDVYSFGVVALELACGRKSVQHDPTLVYDWLLQWVWRCYADGILLEACDEKLMGDFDSREMERLMVVGLWCTHHDPARRPQMTKVLRVLQFLEEPRVR